MFNKIKKLLGMEYRPSSDEIEDTLDDMEFDGSVTVTELIRHQLKGVTLDFVKSELELSEKERKELQANAELLRVNPVFYKIIDYLINIQGNFSVREAQDATSIFFGRATINGLCLLKEEVERLSNLHREATQPEDKNYNKHDLI